MGGNGGAFGDFTSEGSAKIWPVVIGEAVVILILLIVMLRSVVLPAVAVAFDLLTAAATFGILTLLYSGRRPAARRARATSTRSRSSASSPSSSACRWSTRSRCCTARARRSSRRATPAARCGPGCARRPRAATGAAAVMLAAIIPFATVDLLSVQVFGVGVAIAILLDALIVRPVLLPAAVVAARPLELVAAVAAGAADSASRRRDPGRAPRACGRAARRGVGQRRTTDAMRCLSRWRRVA